MAAPSYVDRCGQRINYVALTAFWLTFGGVYYCGMTHVLPSLYSEMSDWILMLQRAICSIMFFQLTLNWVLTKACSSRYHEDSYEPTKHGDIPSTGYEIDLSQCRLTKDDGQFKIHRDYFHDIPESHFQTGTLYIIDMECEAGASPTRKLVFPYWSWKPCKVCKKRRPPRTHHCPVCNTCVLKRDHHCFFTGSCIGARNQRYFCAFAFWGTIATTYTLVQSITYIFLVHGPVHTNWDIVLPVTMLRFLMGRITAYDLMLLILMYATAWFWLTTVGFFVEQMRCIAMGVTSFENDNHIKIVNNNTFRENFEGVFGRNWWWNFLLPLGWWQQPLENGIDWPSIKV